MTATRRALLLSGIGTVSALTLSRTAFGGTAKPDQTDPMPLLVDYNSSPEKPPVLGYANPGECSHCTFFKVKAGDAFGNCPMSARVSRWQQRPACSTYTPAR
jgi:hypothetical protein